MNLLRKVIKNVEDFIKVNLIYRKYYIKNIFIYLFNYLYIREIYNTISYSNFK